MQSMLLKASFEPSTYDDFLPDQHYAMETFHTCRFCEGIVLNLHETKFDSSSGDGYGEKDLKLAPSPEAAHEASRHGCLLFKTLFQNRANFPPCPENGPLFLKLRFLAGTLAARRIACGWYAPRSASRAIDRTGASSPSHQPTFHVIGTLDMFPLTDNLGIQGLLTETQNPFVGPSKWRDNLDSIFAEARDAILQCRRNHQCRQAAPKFLPSRLVEILPYESQVTARIYSPQDYERMEWASLSYAWGDVKPVVVDGTTLDSWSRKLPVSELPATIQDALIVTLSLGLRYMWVDCLCILQDDAEDKAREIATLPQIFEQASITISAAGSRSCHDGFLPRRVSTGGSLVATRISAVGRPRERHYVFLRPSGREYDQDVQPIHTRAWTLQEHALSPRTLSFGTSHIKFSCREGSRVILGVDFLQSISVHASLPSIDQMKKIATPLDHWYETLRDYTSRTLSDPKDKLPAISGLAQKFASMLDDQYLAGLWKKSLVLDLHWFVCESDHDPEAPSSARLPGPSWSWATTQAEIRRPVMTVGTKQNPLAAVIDCAVTPAFADIPYGSILAGKLRLRGYVFRAYYRHTQTRGSIPGYEGKILGSESEFKGNFVIHPDDRRQDFGAHARDVFEITCLELSEIPVISRPERSGFEIWGLLLEHIPESSAFRRIGLWTYWFSSGSNSYSEDVHLILKEWKDCIRADSVKSVTIE